MDQPPPNSSESRPDRFPFPYGLVGLALGVAAGYLYKQATGYT
jgi:hypothetical protein